MPFSSTVAWAGRKPWAAAAWARARVTEASSISATAPQLVQISAVDAGHPAQEVILVGANRQSVEVGRILEVRQREELLAKDWSHASRRLRLGLGERTFTCTVCGFTADRDTNAARVILAVAERGHRSVDGLRQLPPPPQERTGAA